ncbi:MAG: DUF1800 family protein [Planctomycetota bacterium]
MTRLALSAASLARGPTWGAVGDELLAVPGRAWAQYRSGNGRPWDLRAAGHLYRRLAMGGRWSELTNAVIAGPQQTINRLLAPEGEVAAFNREYDGFEAAVTASDSAAADPLREWWLRRLLETPHPLLERMTLFWHNHFAVSASHVGKARLLRQYLAMLRKHALGKLPELLDAAVKDPALATSRDAAQRSLPRPTAATERAIREATAPAVVVRKLYRWFISELDAPSETLLQPLTDELSRTGDIGGVVRTMASSELFFSAAAYRRRAKNPVEYAISILRPLACVVSTQQLGRDLDALGQDLCRPPTLDGWPEGAAWLTPSLLVGRSNLAAALLAGKEPYGNKVDVQAAASNSGSRSGTAASRWLLDLWLQGDVPPPVLEALRPRSGDDDALRRFAHGLVTLPEFQLS